MPTSFLTVAVDAAVLVYLAILEAPGMGGRGDGGEGRMGGLGSVEWMPTTFVAVAADAAVLVYLSILEAPGMGGKSELWSFLTTFDMCTFVTVTRALGSKQSVLKSRLW